MVRATGTTTLGFFVWTVGLSIFVSLAISAGKFGELKARGVPHPLESALSESAIGVFLVVLAGVVILVWPCFFLATVYQDHVSLADENQKLRDALARREDKGLSFRIDELWAEALGPDSALIQLVVLASNDGEAVTVADWMLDIHVPSKKIIFGMPHALPRAPIDGLPNVRRLDEMFQEPVGVINKRPGYLSFITERLSIDQIEEYCRVYTTEIRVSAWDSLRRTVGARKGVSELKTHFGK